jgi:hypothetical protein
MPTLIRLFIDLTVYREIIVGKISSSILRWGFAYFIISIAMGIWINNQYSPQVYLIIDSLTNQILSTIPESVTFDFKDGILTTTATTSSKYFSVDSYADASTLASSSAVLALGKTHFQLTTSIDGSHETRSYLDEGWQDISLSGKEIRQFGEEFQKTSHVLKPYFPILLVIPIFLFYSFSRLVHTLFYALLLKVFSSSVNRAYRFSHYWQLTLSTVIVADTVNLLVLIAYQQNYPLVFTLAFFGTTLLAYLNLPVEPKKTTPTTPI